MFAQEDRSSANWTGKINKTGPASAPSESTPLIKEIGCPNWRILSSPTSELSKLSS